MLITIGGGVMKEIKREDVQNLSYKDIAYLLIEKEKNGKNTLDLFKEIVDLLDLPQSTIDTKIADFYTSLTTDKRFLMVDGLWDLRNRHTSDKVLSSAQDDDDEEENIEDTDEDMEPEEDNYEDDSESIDDDTNFDDDDDGLSDLVILDEDEMDIENN